MRTHGTLARWNDERGFGFVLPAGSQEELFVHVSAFPRDGRRPQVGELVSFETEKGSNGKLQAVRVMRPGGGPAKHRPRKAAAPAPGNRVVPTLVVVAALIAIGAYGYSRWVEPAAPLPGPAVSYRVPVVPAAAPGFTCDGRTMCSQMTSCAEATYFLRHCPDTKMDGNGDGEPCEQQWCN